MSVKICLVSDRFPLSISFDASSINSLFTSEKLLTKFNGFCISCAMPAVSSPREAIFLIERVELEWILVGVTPALFFLFAVAITDWLFAFAGFSYTAAGLVT